MLAMKTLLTGAYPYTTEQLSALRALGAELVFVQEEREPLGIDVQDIEAVVCNSLFLYNDIAAFKALKLIQATSAGLDRLPLDYIRQHGITLFNARGIYSVPMAEFAVLGTLQIYKHSFAFFENQQKGIWQKQRTLSELTNKRVLLVGAGSVGTACAKRFAAFDAEVVGVDAAAVQSPFYQAIYPLAALEQQVRVADVVILTLPLTDETRGMFGERMLTQMKPTAVLVNLARGALVDENALIAALAGGKLGGAVLDVFAEEPLSSQSPLWHMDNVIVTPHNSFVSDQTNERLFALIYKHIQNFLERGNTSETGYDLP